MSRITRLRLVDQVAETIRVGLREGRWGAQLPGVRRLAAELGVSKLTLVKSIRMLEDEGLLAKQGESEARSVIHTDGKPGSQRKLRVALLVASGVKSLRFLSGSYNVLRLVTMIQDAGHDCFVVSNVTIARLKSSSALSRLTKDNPADAWVVFAGSREMYHWFAASGHAVMALGGPCLGLPMAATGYCVAQAMETVTARLLSLGHSRIVMLNHEIYRNPKLSDDAKNLLAQMEAVGVPTGDYNLPNWKETPEGITAMLESLFRHTPPTAIICKEVTYTHAVLAFLAQKNLKIPSDVSVVSVLEAQNLDWQLLGLNLTTFDVDQEGNLKRIIQWLDGVRLGRPEIVQSFTQARVNWGETIGPPPA